MGDLEEVTKKNSMQSHLGDAPLAVKREHSTSPRHSNIIQKKSLDSDIAEDVDNQSIANNSYQLVLYNPDPGSISQTVHDQIDDQASSFQNVLAPRPSSRILPSIGAFTVQCAACFKWRLIPTKEKYEEIREIILQELFVCDRAREWRSDISCGDPGDISQDGSRLWAIDKPNIPRPPPGWERLLRFRGEGSTKFADVYYVAPTGKRMRSMVEVQKYLFDHPEYLSGGVKLSQFSFQTPRPLQENYIRKRPARLTNAYSDAGLRVPTPLEPVKANPLSWVMPTTYKDLQNGEARLSDPYLETRICHPSIDLPQPAKKKKKSGTPPSRQTYNGPQYDQINSEFVDAERPRYTSTFGIESHVSDAPNSQRSADRSRLLNPYLEIPICHHSVDLLQPAEKKKKASSLLSM